MDNQHANLLHPMDEHFDAMAYSIGAIWGDGTIGIYTQKAPNGNIYSTPNVRITAMDYDIVNRVCCEVNEYFGKKYKVVEYRNPNGTTMFRSIVSSRITYDFFRYFIKNKAFLPDELFRSSRDAQLRFIAGLFDTDGYVSMSKNPRYKLGYQWMMGFSSRHRTLVEDVSKILKKLGVKVGKIRNDVSPYETLIFSIRPNIRSFIESGGYFHTPRKAKRLALYEQGMSPLKDVTLASETIMPSP